MRRLLYCLLGSALFHAALLWVPLPMSAGGAGEDDLLLVRVRLVEAPRSDAVKRSPRRDERAERHGRVRQARTEPRAAPEPQRGPTVVRKKAEPTQPTAAASAARKPPGTVDGDRGVVGTSLNAGTVRSNREIGSARNTARGTPAEQVTTGADFSPVRYARTVKPRYPRKARRAGWEGTTLLKVLVNPDGAPGRVTVERTSGFDVLDEAAVKAVRRWRFHPARRGVAPLSSWVRIPVAFRLEEVRR
ncbi:MAG: energy transducer TonB [Deltaproteobacteria bacterium]|nr:energy transducer TonB [Deltaproteobacteria bacterium]